MAQRSFEDCRRFRRRTVRILVDYRSESGLRCDYATTLGAGGVFIETEDPLPRDSVLKMRFRLPESDEIHEIEGRVRWQRVDVSHGPGMGIQFTDTVAAAQLARELEDLQ